jgi:uroporphyrin-3 C-methyltransferase
MTAEIETLTADMNTRRTGSGVSPMWFAFAASALLLALYAHWRFTQFDQRIDRLRAQVVEMRTTQARITSQLSSLTTRLEQSEAQFRTQLRTLREVPTQVGELGQTVAELRARTETPQRAWVRAEALYLLELAGRRLRFEHDVATAIAAMESADARLATVDDPAVVEVRAQLARELTALRAVAVPDVADIITRLTRLEAQAAELRVLGTPIAKTRRANRPKDGTAAGSLGPIERAANRLSQAWQDLFSLRKVEPSRSRLVTREEEALRRQHLDLLLFGARLSALQRDAAAYRQSLQSAGEWLDRFFDSRDPAVKAARTELAALATIDVDPARPEIGMGAQLLQRVIGTSTSSSAPAAARRP